MQIGQAATSTGVSAKMIRHYEAIGLIPSADRQASNYRDYDDGDLHRLRFIGRARDLGFSIARIRDLLKLWSDRSRCSSEVKAIALAHVAEMELKITHMREMADVLHGLADACEGDGRPDCPIIRDLAGRGPCIVDPSRTRADNQRSVITAIAETCPPGFRPGRIGLIVARLWITAAPPISTRIHRS